MNQQEIGRRRRLEYISNSSMHIRTIRAFRLPSQQQMDETIREIQEISDECKMDSKKIIYKTSGLFTKPEDRTYISLEELDVMLIRSEVRWYEFWCSCHKYRAPQNVFRFNVCNSCNKRIHKDF